MSLALDVRCGCQHRLPLRVQPDGLAKLREIVAATSAPPTGAEVLLTFRCADCKQVVSLSLGDLGIARGAA